MTYVHERISPNEEHPDYEVRLALLEHDYPKSNWSSTTRELLLEGSKEMDRRNGERPYHDGLHPLDVIRNAYQELEERATILGRTLTPLDYEALGLACIYHDIDVDADAEGTPESRSAEYVQAKMRAYKPNIYPEHQITRVGNLVIATTAQYVDNQVLQPMATEIPADFCAPSILYGDVGDVLHNGWTRVALSMGKLAAEELFKLKIGDNPLDKVMGIFDKQEEFSEQRFEDWPKIIKYHCGDDDGERYLTAWEERRRQQENIISQEYLHKLQQVRNGFKNASLLIIENKFMTYHNKGDAFFRTVMSLLGNTSD